MISIPSSLYEYPALPQDCPLHAQPVQPKFCTCVLYQIVYCPAFSPVSWIWMASSLRAWPSVPEKPPSDVQPDSQPMF